MNTSNRSFVAKVSGNQPGTLMSRFFWAALWLNTYSNLVTKFSYFCFSSFNCLFLSSSSLSFSLNWCFIELILLSWIPFSSATCLALLLYISLIWFLIRLLSSFSFKSHLTVFSLNSLLRSFSLCSKRSIFRLLSRISSSLIWMCSLSYLIIC